MELRAGLLKKTIFLFVEALHRITSCHIIHDFLLLRPKKMAMATRLLELPPGRDCNCHFDFPRVKPYQISGTMLFLFDFHFMLPNGNGYNEFYEGKNKGFNSFAFIWPYNLSIFCH